MSILENVDIDKNLKGLSIDELYKLSDEIRNVIIGRVLQNGGHMASNLGVVELMVALHYAFDLPSDKLVLDVGHQCYAHKILSGRLNMFETLRQYGGLSGFPKCEESEFDTFNTGHSSTSISAGMGYAKARDLCGESYNVVSVIGDGSISSGMAFEAINNLGLEKTKMIIILNDNTMSISKNVGAMSEYLAKMRVSRRYNRFKQRFQRALSHMSFIGKYMEKFAKKTRNFFKRILVKGLLFEQLGLKYIGPIDGHDIQDMTKIFNEAKNLQAPVIIHVITQKGRGYAPAESQPELYHGVSNGECESPFSKAVGEAVCELAERDERVVAITAAMKHGTGLVDFADKFKKRFFDVGISEQHAVTFAAGMAKGGLRPYVFIYSTFLQRAYDQILHDVCLQNLPVTLCIDRAGINPRDGETHHGIYDISYLSAMPNIEIFDIITTEQLRMAAEYSLQANNPVAIRYPSDSIDSVKFAQAGDIKNWSYVVKNKSRTLILACSMRMMKIALAVSKMKNVDIVNACYLSKIDTDILDSYRTVITMEDGVLSGGFGEKVSNYILGKRGVSFKAFGYPSVVIPHGDADSLLKLCRITAEEVAKYAN